jgi:hypothetical protein
MHYNLCTYIVIFLQKYVHVIIMVLSLYKFFTCMVYNLNGPVVIALASKSEIQSSSHTWILKNV